MTRTRWVATLQVELSAPTIDQALEQLRELVKDLPRPVVSVVVNETIPWGEPDT